jgi:hypothetical protein
LGLQVAQGPSGVWLAVVTTSSLLVDDARAASAGAGAEHAIYAAYPISKAPN